MFSVDAAVRVGDPGLADESIIKEVRLRTDVLLKTAFNIPEPRLCSKIRAPERVPLILAEM
jgi:hypothetical protein